jgi:hypothetical protein
VVYPFYRKRHESCIVLDEGNKTMAFTLYKGIGESFLDYFVNFFYSRSHPAEIFNVLNPLFIWIKKGRPPFLLRLPRFTRNGIKKEISPFLMAKVHNSGQISLINFASDFEID